MKLLDADHAAPPRSQSPHCTFAWRAHMEAAARATRDHADPPTSEPLRGDPRTRQRDRMSRRSPRADAPLIDGACIAADSRIRVSRKTFGCTTA